MTGGWDSYDDYLDSTELLVPGSGSWRLAAGLLPRPMAALRVATAANTLYGSYHVNLYLTGEWSAFIRLGSLLSTRAQCVPMSLNKIENV